MATNSREVPRETDPDRPITSSFNSTRSPSGADAGRWDIVFRTRLMGYVLRSVACPFPSTEAAKMAVHAAMVDRIDREVGRLFAQIRAMGVWEKTLILLLSDNGASAEIMVRGMATTGRRLRSVRESWRLAQTHGESHDVSSCFRNASAVAAVRHELLSVTSYLSRQARFQAAPEHAAASS